MFAVRRIGEGISRRNVNLTMDSRAKEIVGVKKTNEDNVNLDKT